MTTAIRTGEAGAVEALTARIEAAEALQAKMKAVNARIKKVKNMDQATQVAALVELGETEGDAYKLLAGDYMGRIGYASYCLTNNNANIKRMKDQLAKAQKMADTESSTIEIGAVRVVDNAEADRVQIYFPVERVDRALYQMIQQHGFRHTPSLGCFQAHRGESALYWAKRIAAKYEESQNVLQRS